MTAPRAPGSAQTSILALDVALGLAGVLVLALGVTQRVAPEVGRLTFDADPGMRATALALGVLGWIVWTSARLTATGARRVVGRLAAIGLATAAAVRFVGLRALETSNALLLPGPGSGGMRAIVAGVLLLAAAAWVYRSSPARRRRR